MMQVGFFYCTKILMINRIPKYFLITTTKDMSRLDFVMGSVEQDIISNYAQIPIMCINPRKGKVGGFSATGG